MLNQLSAFELIEGIGDKKFSSVEVAEAFVEQVKKRDADVNAFLRFDPSYVLDQAKAFDQKHSSNTAFGSLSGIPVAVKDVICVKGQVTSCASKMLEHFVSPYDATLIEKIKRADGILLGTTNMDEFAMGSSNENSAFSRTKNPWDTDRVPGGSSGGAAACVAAGMAPLSLGSDTGGSVRQPAAFCGVTGLKPTYGRISRYGLVAFASSLDQIGILAGDARDVALLLNESTGHDPKDSTSSPTDPADYMATLHGDVSGLKIGIPKEYLGEGLDPEIAESVRQARQTLEEMGVEFTEISLPMTSYGVATYYLVASCEASGNLARYDGAHYGFRTEKNVDAAENRLLEMYRQTRSEGFGAEVKRRIMLGTYALSSGYYDAYYLKALKTRRLIQDELNAAFKQVDLILGPTTPTPAFKLGEKKKDPLSMYLGDIYTVVANLAGIPAISFPSGFTQSGLPIGLQLQGPSFSEELILRTTCSFQKNTDWHTKKPAMVTGAAK